MHARPKPVTGKRMTENKVGILIEKIKSGYSLPVLSPAALKLVELASDDKSSARDLVNLIEKDPSLAVRLLKLANSAFFKTVHKCSTLNQAVVRVGFNRLRIMALSISLRDIFPLGKTGPFDYNKFWLISLYRALIARSLAGYVRSTNPDEAFVAALIRETGLLIFYDLMIREDRADGISFDLEPVEDLLAWEKKRYGIDHREVGEAVFRHWNFPENIIACMSSCVIRDDTGKVSDLDTVCKLAELFSGVLFHESGLFLSIYEEAEKHLGISINRINDILLDTFRQVDDIAACLKVEVDREKDLISVMEKANIALSQISDRIARGEEAVREGGELPSFDTINSSDHAVNFTLQAVAHEIRNPLMAVGGFAKKLSDSLEPDSEGGRYLKIILKEAARLEKVLSGMTQEKPS